MDALNFGIIGLGSVADQHIKSILESEYCNLVAVCSRSNTKLEEAKLKYNVETFQDYQRMVENPDIDVVSICTPSGFHLEPTLASAKARKHVLVEKPLEVSVERAKKMISACKEASVQLSCIFQNRFSDDFQKLKKAAEDGALGKLVLGNAYIKWFRDQNYYDSTSWRGTFSGDGGAALINQSIHTIDLLLQVMGPVRSVMGKIKTLTHDIEGEDLGTAVLEFENGALGTIEGSTSIYKGYPEKLEIHGDRGNIILESGRITQWECKDSEIESSGDNQRHASGSSDPTAIGHKLHKRQIEAFAKNILENKVPEVDGESAIKSLEVIQAIYESSKTGREVRI